MSLEQMRLRARNMAVALELIDGGSAAAACRNAGYATSTAAKKGYRIIQRPGVRKALVELGEVVAKECKADTRAYLLATMRKGTVSTPTLVFAIRLATDEARVLGSLREYVKCQQADPIPPGVRALLAQRVAELAK